MPVEGLEPPRPKALVPKTSVYTNFTTPAYCPNCLQKYTTLYEISLKEKRLAYLKILAGFWLKSQRRFIPVLSPNGGQKFLLEEVCSQFSAFRNIFAGKSAL